VPRRSCRWVWAGRLAFGVIVAGLVVYLVTVGLERADKLASTISLVVALAAFVAPYLLPAPGVDGVSGAVPDQVVDTGTARATNGGQANTGMDLAGGDRPTHVARSGNAVADGSGSVANTGVLRRPRQ